METTILTVMLLLIVTLLARKEQGNNNIFTLLCLAIIVSGVWTISPDKWEWKVIALYVTEICFLCTVFQKKEYIQSKFSILTWIYGARITKKYGIYSGDALKKINKFGKLIKEIRIILLFILCSLVTIYSCFLVMGAVWWKWLIIGPAGIIAIFAVLYIIKYWTNKL